MQEQAHGLREQAHSSCQGTTSVVPKATAPLLGFSPCGFVKEPQQLKPFPFRFLGGTIEVVP